MASLSRTVHFRSIQEVIDGYVKTNCPHFALFTGKQLVFGYDDETATIEEGEEHLAWWCNKIDERGSAGIYSVCFYKNLKGQITNTTPYNSSFNFQLHEYKFDNPYSNQVTRYNQDNNPELKLLANQVAALTEQIKQMKEEAEGEEPEQEDATERIIGKVSTLLSNPVIAGLIGNLMGGKGMPQVTHTAEDGTGKVTRIAGITLTPEQNKTIAESLEVLKRSTDKLPTILERLALLAVRKPKQFKFYESMLLTMKL